MPKEAELSFWQDSCLICSWKLKPWTRLTNSVHHNWKVIEILSVYRRSSTAQPVSLRQAWQGHSFILLFYVSCMHDISQCEKYPWYKSKSKRWLLQSSFHSWQHTKGLLKARMKANIELGEKEGLGLSQRVQQAPYIVKHTETPNTWVAESNALFGTQTDIYTVSPKRRESGWPCHEIKEHTNWRWSRVMWNVEDPKTSPNVPKMEGVQLNPHYRSGAKWSATWQGRAAMDSPPQFS